MLDRNGGDGERVRVGQAKKVEKGREREWGWFFLPARP